MTPNLPAFPCRDTPGWNASDGSTCATFARGQPAHKKCAAGTRVGTRLLADVCAKSCDMCSCRDDVGADCSVFIENGKAGDLTPLGVPSKCTQSPFAARMRKCRASCGNCAHCTVGVEDLTREDEGIFVKASSCADPKDEPGWRSPQHPGVSCQNYSKGIWHRHCKEDGADLHCLKSCRTCQKFKKQYFAERLQQTRIVQLVDLIDGSLREELSEDAETRGVSLFLN